MANTRQEIGKLHRRLQKFERMTAKFYEDKVSGAVSESTFSVLIMKNEQERFIKAERLDALLSEVKKSDQDAADIQSWATTIRKYLNL